MLSVLELHEISEADHRILDPITDARLLELAALARVGPGTRVLDLACGKGEMLCRWAQAFDSSGVGVDISPVFTEAARKRAGELGVAGRVAIEHADASSYQAIRERSTSPRAWAPPGSAAVSPEPSSCCARPSPRPGCW